MARDPEASPVQQAVSQRHDPSPNGRRPRPPGPNDVQPSSGKADPPKPNPMRPRPWWVSFLAVLVLNYLLVPCSSRAASAAHRRALHVLQAAGQRGQRRRDHQPRRHHPGHVPEAARVPARRGQIARALDATSRRSGRRLPIPDSRRCSSARRRHQRPAARRAAQSAADAAAQLRPDAAAHRRLPLALQRAASSLGGGAASVRDGQEPGQALRPDGRGRQRGSPSPTWPASTRPRQELVEIVDFLKDPKKYTRLGGDGAQGRAAGRRARDGQDAAGQGRRRRGQRAVLQHGRQRVRRDDRRRGRQPRARPVQAGPRGGPGHHLHRRAGRDRPRARGGHRLRRQTTSGADAQPDPDRDGRLQLAARASSCWRRPTARTCWTRRCCARAGSTAASRSSRPTRSGARRS